MRQGRRSKAGFTLIEVIVVLAVLSLGLALLTMRGPPRSAALEIRAAAGEMAQALRLARAQSIARNAPVRVVLDPARGAWAVDGAAARVLPPGIVLALRVAETETLGDRLGAIRFAPDGSSTGGVIELADDHRRLQIGVDWLSGRVTLAEAKADAR
jgi:general secretion pathway protein H